MNLNSQVESMSQANEDTVDQSSFRLNLIQRRSSFDNLPRQGELPRNG